MRLLVRDLLMLPKGKDLLKLPYKPERIHPLHSKLVLLACHLSGNPSVKKVFESKPFKSSWHPGETPPKNNMLDIYKTWQRFCSGRKLDMFSPPVEEVLHFLTELLEASCGYSALNTVHCLPLLFCLETCL